MQFTAKSGNSEGDNDPVAQGNKRIPRAPDLQRPRRSCAVISQTSISVSYPNNQS